MFEIVYMKETRSACAVILTGWLGEAHCRGQANCQVLAIFQMHKGPCLYLKVPDLVLTIALLHVNLSQPLSQRRERKLGEDG